MKLRPEVPGSDRIAYGVLGVLMYLSIGAAMVFRCRSNLDEVARSASGTLHSLQEGIVLCSVLQPHV
jgi:hypothetical protein